MPCFPSAEGTELANNVPRKTYYVTSLLPRGSTLSVCDGLSGVTSGESRSVTVDVGGPDEAAILSTSGSGKLSIDSSVLEFTPMSGYVQRILPVITDDHRIVGVVSLDAPTAFNGDEVAVVVGGVTLAVRRIQYDRAGPPQVMVDMMAVPVRFSPDAGVKSLSLPAFQEVSVMTGHDLWIMVASLVIYPGNVSKNQLQELLTRTSY